MKSFYSIIFAVIFFAGCGGSTNESTISDENQVNPTVQNLHDQVMEYHDEVMPDMGEIYSLQNELESAADSLPSPQSETLREYATSLAEADEAMMGWMRQFTAQLANEDTTAAIAYYEDQLIKVKDMRDKVVQALAEGRAAKADLEK